MTDLVCVYSDTAVARLVQAVGLEKAIPGHRFSGENGDAIVNSKAVFRAVAVAAGVPIAPGGVTGRREEAESLIRQLLAQGPVMVKLEFSGGGLGNEVLTRAPGLRGTGALRTILLPDDQAVSDYLDDRWEWLTGEHKNRLVVEKYIPDTTTVYAEFTARDDGCRLSGTGEILFDPISFGEVIPPQSIDDKTHERLVEFGLRVCELFQALGYRGNICADAIVTSTGELFFTEVNGRLTASTHLHRNLVAHVVGASHPGGRVFLEKGGQITVPTFKAALERLAASGLAYDSQTGRGVVLTANYVPVSGKVTYCIVDEAIQAARSTEQALFSLMSETHA